jgi:prepilin-type N-terminal cleavage/methylation domain-containing protein
MKRKMHGFTLIELMIVASICGILAAIVFQVYNRNYANPTNFEDIAKEYCASNSIEVKRVSCYKDDNFDNVCVVMSDEGKIYMKCEYDKCFEIMPD